MLNINIKKKNIVNFSYQPHFTLEKHNDTLIALSNYLVTS